RTLNHARGSHDGVIKMRKLLYREKEIRKYGKIQKTMLTGINIHFLSKILRYIKNKGNYKDVIPND
uniref:hypothetical protein n=1 Tax=uncultured Parabacteroides sp. TaxID=512312 RepID=UPI00260718CB